jgi:hypothetical protein
MASPKMLPRWEKAKHHIANRHGASFVIFVEEWAAAMEKLLLEGKSFSEIAIPTANKLNNAFIDLEVAIDILVLVWEKGENLQDWYQNVYGS